MRACLLNLPLCVACEEATQAPQLFRAGPSRLSCGHTSNPTQPSPPDSTQPNSTQRSSPCVSFPKKRAGSCTNRLDIALPAAPAKCKWKMQTCMHASNTSARKPNKSRHAQRPLQARCRQQILQTQNPDHPKTCGASTSPKRTLLAACRQGNYRALLQQPGSAPARHSLCSNMQMSCRLRLACQSGDTLAQLTNVQPQRFVTSDTLSHLSHMPSTPKNPTRTGCRQRYTVVCPTPNRNTCTVRAAGCGKRSLVLDCYQSRGHLARGTPCLKLSRTSDQLLGADHLDAAPLPQNERARRPLMASAIKERHGQTVCFGA